MFCTRLNVCQIDVEVVNFVDAWHPCHSYQSKIIPFRIDNVHEKNKKMNKKIWFVDFDIMCVWKGVEFPFILFSSLIHTVTTISPSFPSCMFTFCKCVTIYTHTHRHTLRETLMQLSIYTLPIVVMGPCSASDFFGMFHQPWKGMTLIFRNKSMEGMRLNNEGVY